MSHAVTERKRVGNEWQRGPRPVPSDVVAEPTELVEPTELAEPVAVPEPPGLTPIAYQITYASPPADIDPEALALLAQARGAVAVTELVGAIGVLDSNLHSRIWGLSGPPDLIEAVPSMLDWRARRDVYAARLAALVAILGCDPPDIGDPPMVPQSSLFDRDPHETHLGRGLARDEGAVRRCLDDLTTSLSSTAMIAANDASYGNVGRQYQVSWAELDRRIAEHESAIQRLRKATSGMKPLPLPPHMWPQDGLLSRASNLLGQQRVARDDLAAIDADKARAVELVKAGIAAAIAAAGGVASVETAVTAALTLGSPAEVSPVELDAIDARIAQLRAAGVESGPSIDGLMARRTEVMAASIVTTANTRAGRRERAGSMVRDALAGQESARQQLETLATSQPTAFPVGFAEAVAEARADRAEFASLRK